jgi:hypothetical protein
MKATVALMFALISLPAGAWGASPWASAIFPPGTPGGAAAFRRVQPGPATERSQSPVREARLLAAQCAVTSYAYGIPPHLLLAIAITESGRHGAPWPWTLDVDGQPAYLAGRRALMRAAEEALRAGHTRIDIGPMQVDWRYHGAMFPSLAAVTRPFMNIAAAGHILARLHARWGHWWLAVAAYHSAIPKLGRPYMWRVYRVYARLCRMHPARVF